MQRGLERNKCNEAASIKNGVASTVVISLTTNYFTIFAIAVLGASNFQASLITSLPQIVGVFSIIPAAMIVNRLVEKKNFTAYCILATRIFILFMIFVPYVKGEYSAWVFILLVGLMNLPGTFTLLSWQTLIGDIIPEKNRNTFFGKRNKILTFVGMVVTLLIGLLMRSQDKGNPLPYQLLFAVALIAGGIEVYYMFKHREIERTGEKKEKGKIFSFAVFKHKPYVQFLMTGLFFNFAWQMAWTLFGIYQVRYAHANLYWISLFGVANQFSQVITYPWWARMAEKHGNGKMLVWAALGMAMAPILTVISPNLYYQLAINFATGVFVAGTVLYLFNGLLEVSLEKDRAIYLSTYNFLLSIIASFAPTAGVFLLDSFDMNTAMLTSAVFRGVAAVFFGYFAYYVNNRKSGFVDGKSVINH